MKPFFLNSFKANGWKNRTDVCPAIDTLCLCPVMDTLCLCDDKTKPEAKTGSMYFDLSTFAVGCFLTALWGPQVIVLLVIFWVSGVLRKNKCVSSSAGICSRRANTFGVNPRLSLTSLTSGVWIWRHATAVRWEWFPTTSSSSVVDTFRRQTSCWRFSEKFTKNPG